ncbi:MAG: HPF/RaiA family ribosome-associated protein [Candidatus Omnitrophica bacterium]|nr:HPF/RaiA family ribosome-associated protein [Candidatus Omnitrophota bacterium]
MQNPLVVTFHDLPHYPQIEKLISEKFAKLQTINSDVTKCHVILEKLSKHHQKANSSCVRLDLKVPHLDDIVITEKCSDDEADLASNVIKVFKLGQLSMREGIKRKQDRQRVPRPNLVESVEEPE